MKRKVLKRLEYFLSFDMMIVHLYLCSYVSLFLFQPSMLFYNMGGNWKGKFVKKRIWLLHTLFFFSSLSYPPNKMNGTFFFSEHINYTSPSTFLQFSSQSAKIDVFKTVKFSPCYTFQQITSLFILQFQDKVFC